MARGVAIISRHGPARSCWRPLTRPRPRCSTSSRAPPPTSCARLGYSSSMGAVIDALWYGVSQHRRRAILVAFQEPEAAAAFRWPAPVADRAAQRRPAPVQADERPTAGPVLKPGGMARLAGLLPSSAAARSTAGRIWVRPRSKTPGASSASIAWASLMASPALTGKYQRGVEADVRRRRRWPHADDQVRCADPGLPRGAGPSAESRPAAGGRSGIRLPPPAARAIGTGDPRGAGGGALMPLSLPGRMGGSSQRRCGRLARGWPEPEGRKHSAGLPPGVLTPRRSRRVNRNPGPIA